MTAALGRSNLERRLQKLQAVLTDNSCAVPHTYKWLLYWTEQIGKYMSEERKPLAAFIPLEAFRAVMKACAERQVDSTYAQIVRCEDCRDGETAT
jgi:hypothetical protein